jgi:hypothetical protein
MGKRRVKRNPEQILPCSLPLSKDFDVAVERICNPIQIGPQREQG